MEAKELRIGNYATIDNEKYHPQVKGISMVVTGVKETLGLENELTYSVNLKPTAINPNQYYETYSQFIEYIKPIPLTEEWLIKFGFEKDNSTYSWSKIIEDEQRQLCIEIESFPNEKGFWYLSKHFNQLRHVHQLQNIFSALTGQELTLR